MAGGGNALDLFDHLEEGIMLVDAHGVVRFWNRWMSLYTKRSRDQVVGRHLDELFPEIDGRVLRRKIRTCLAVGVPTFQYNLQSGHFIRIPFKKLTGSPFPHMQQNVVIYPYDREGGLAILMLQDQTALREAQFKLQKYQGMEEERRKFVTDPLTGLANRAQMLQDIQKSQAPKLALLALDLYQELSRFYGFEMGEWLLLRVAERLRGFFRGEGLRLYKLASAEFAVLAGDGVTNREFLELLEQLQSLSPRETWYHGESAQYVPVTFTVGVSTLKAHLLRQADMALKAAQARQKSLLVFDESMDDHQRLEENIRWLNVLKDALDDDRIVPYYQPLVNNVTGRIEKYEVLVRLIDIHGQVVTPFHFLEVAKRGRLYHHITARILDAAFATFAAADCDFSINLSVEDIRDRQTVERILAILVKHPEAARHVIFEILESEGIENFAQVSRFMEQARAHGARFAIDDFGTGYSNFEYLVRLKVDVIKIDGSLIRNIDLDRNAFMVVETLVGFARRSGIRTVAEYVDSNNVFQMVKDLGVDFSQGFFLGKPEAAIAPPERREGRSSILLRDHLDAFQELMNISFGSAMSILAGLIDSFAVLDVPIIDVMDDEKLKRFMGFKIPRDKPHFFVVQSFVGGVSGEVILFMDRESALDFACVLNNQPPSFIDDKVMRGAVVELTNLIATACVKHFAEHLGLSTRPTIPVIQQSLELAISRGGEGRGGSGHVVMVESLIRFTKGRIQGGLLLLTRAEPVLLGALDHYLKG